MFGNLMIDLETMGTAPDAAIVSVGAVLFNEADSDVGPCFYRNINLADSVALGFKLDPGTVMWWLGQSEYARNAIRFNGSPVRSVLEDLVQFIAVGSGVERSRLKVWGNSPSFDCVKLQAHFDKCGVQAPWLYFNERCYRTIRERNRNVAQDDNKAVHHNALDDAIHQARHLQKIRRFHVERNAGLESA